MKPLYMLDTNMCIFLMRQTSPSTQARFDRCFVGEVVISAVTLAELEFGVACSGERREQNRRALDGLIEDIPVAAFDAPAAQAYGPIREATRERSRDALDKLIAAHAVSLDVVLVTNNTADLAAYPGLTIEDWAAA